MCTGTVIATLVLILLAAVVVILIVYARPNRHSQSDEVSGEQLSLFGDVDPGFDPDPDEFTRRIYQKFSHAKKGR